MSWGVDRLRRRRWRPCPCLLAAARARRAAVPRVGVALGRFLSELSRGAALAQLSGPGLPDPRERH